MGDPITSALVSDLVGRLTSAAIQEVGLLWGLEDDLLALNNTFRQIQGVLHDAEKKQTTQKDVEEWLKTLKSASLEVENVIVIAQLMLFMDDVWIENKEMEKWDELCKALSCGAKGSTVMVTTRKEDTAQLMAKDS
ncbi:disease resistance protein [Tanacetum coccineum]